MTEITPTLDDHEKAVLERLDWAGGEYFWGFDTIAVDMQLEHDQVRNACHSLKAKGLACFARGLMTEDGELAGSGYGITDNGRRYLAAIQPVQISPNCNKGEDHE